MIIEFSVKNFRSIFEIQTISFASTNLESSADNQQVDENNIVLESKLKLLKIIGIYGANASGKSNIVKALEYFCQAVSDLPSPESRISKLTQPFIYQNDSENTDSFFQIVIILSGKKFRYGFTVKKNHNLSNGDKFSKELVTNEWLYESTNSDQVKYFTRSGLKIEKTNDLEIVNIAPLVYEHSLFLVHAASYDNNICATIRNFISGFITSEFNKRSDYYRFHSIRQIENYDSKSRFLSFFNSFGLEYDDIEFVRDEHFESDNIFPLERVFLRKTVFNNGKITSILNMQNNESDGTKKLFDIAGLLLLAFNNKKSGLIILDEIDSNFHPSLLISLIKNFNDPEINKSNIQLLFTSHDTNLMSPSILRRDQFYFVEKNYNESTTLYSLADLKGIKDDADFAKQYLAGYYGGVPTLSKFLFDYQKENYETMGN